MKLFFLYAGIALLGFGLIFFWNGSKGPSEPVNNVSLVDGQQIIEVTAKGGYTPRTTFAKADTPTTLIVKTNGTFDCSSALVIPSINFSTYLDSTGEKEVQIPAQAAGSILKGVCGMGMYSFEIKFT